MQYETTYYNLLDLFQKVVSDFHIQQTSRYMVKEGYRTGDYPRLTEYPLGYQHVTTIAKGKACIKEISDKINDNIERK